jgi:hypothetical protein
LTLLVSTHKLLPVVVNFIEALGNAALAAITANNSGLTGSGIPRVTITTILAGDSSVTFDRRVGHIHKATLTGKISPTVTDGIVKGD